jgi:hypothetical protein
MSCVADVLAGKSARYDVNNSAPRSAVKGLNVIPNREMREKSVILSGAQYACCIWLPFDGADGSPSEKFSPKYSATSACEKSQLIHLIQSQFFRVKKTGTCWPRRFFYL